jgi:peptidoglycan/xylan/chitin deacetylase (PgdA/CDA1 family)
MFGTGRERVFVSKKTHIVTLSFDDGFQKSFYQTADIYERFGLRACFNVIATGHEPAFCPMPEGRPDAGIASAPLGNFEDWNRLKKRGHEVMAHTYDHTNLTKIPLEQAKEHIAKCADYFEKHLEGFQASESVYNFAYNASTPELEQYALTRFLAARTSGKSPFNPIPTEKKPVLIHCWSHGPDNCDRFFEETLQKFLATEGGWFVFNTHGLDNEGWGPMSAQYLTSLLKRLVGMEQVEVLPAAEVVLHAGK